MTMHYNETVTAKEVWEGWVYHGRRMPCAFATTTDGDSIAYNVWNYLSRLEKGTAPSVETFWSGHPSSMIVLTKQVVAMWMKDRGQR